MLVVDNVSQDQNHQVEWEHRLVIMTLWLIFLSQWTVITVFETPMVLLNASVMAGVYWGAFLYLLRRLEKRALEKTPPPLLTLTGKSSATRRQRMRSGRTIVFLVWMVTLSLLTVFVLRPGAVALFLMVLVFIAKEIASTERFLVLTESGIHHNDIFGSRQIAWEEIERYELNGEKLTLFTKNGESIAMTMPDASQNDRVAAIIDSQ